MAGERVTAAVVVKDRCELMARCLDALLQQDLDAPYEIVVVDNGSTDGTPEMVRARAARASVPIRVVDCAGPIGRARNAAVTAAGAPVVAFTDSDCEPEPGWLRAGLDALDDAPRVGIVQGCTRPPADAPRGRWSATQELTTFTNRYETCNIFYRRDALAAAGGFDETIGFFGEDTAAGWAVRRAGWDARFADGAVVRHVVTHPGLVWHLRRALRYGNVNALVRRFPEMREQLLWQRLFLRPRSAAFTALVAGVALGAVQRRFLVLALPYLWLRRPKGRHRGDLMDAAGAAAFDAAVFAGLVRGSVRERTVVL
jgi:cellulose synthase/poly-beta-1,6-N-acetylglucosamine synthase-like glycosyltransferase